MFITVNLPSEGTDGPEETLFELFSTEMALKQVVSPVIRAETACR